MKQLNIHHSFGGYLKIKEAIAKETQITINRMDEEPFGAMFDIS